MADLVTKDGAAMTRSFRHWSGGTRGRHYELSNSETFRYVPKNEIIWLLRAFINWLRLSSMAPGSAMMHEFSYTFSSPVIQQAQGVHVLDYPTAASYRWTVRDRVLDALAIRDLRMFFWVQYATVRH